MLNSSTSSILQFEQSQSRRRSSTNKNRTERIVSKKKESKLFKLFPTSQIGGLLDDILLQSLVCFPGPGPTDRNELFFIRNFADKLEKPSMTKMVTLYTMPLR